jgi:WD40 repeat protein
LVGDFDRFDCNEANEPKPGPASDAYGDPLPAGSMARLGTLRFRATDRIDHLAFSHDGKELLSRGGGTITIWDAETGRRLAEFSSNAVGPLAWRADGSGVMLVTEPDGTQRLFDFPREQLKRVPIKETAQSLDVGFVGPPADNEQISRYAISPDGLYLVAGRRGNHDRSRHIDQIPIVYESGVGQI